MVWDNKYLQAELKVQEILHKNLYNIFHQQGKINMKERNFKYMYQKYREFLKGLHTFYFDEHDRSNIRYISL